MRGNQRFKDNQDNNIITPIKVSSPFSSREETNPSSIPDKHTNHKLKLKEVLDQVSLKEGESPSVEETSHLLMGGVNPFGNFYL